jgi:hypothetical protein
LPAQATRRLWITPHGLIKAALKYNATVQAQVEGGKKTTMISFTVPGQFKVKTLVNEKNLVEKVESWNTNPVLGDMLTETGQVPDAVGHLVGLHLDAGLADIVGRLDIGRRVRFDFADRQVEGREPALLLGDLGRELHTAEILVIGVDACAVPGQPASSHAPA